MLMKITTQIYFLLRKQSVMKLKKLKQEKKLEFFKNIRIINDKINELIGEDIEFEVDEDFFED